jgi:hypothetical protein
MLAAEKCWALGAAPEVVLPAATSTLEAVIRAEDAGKHTSEDSRSAAREAVSMLVQIGLPAHHTAPLVVRIDDLIGANDTDRMFLEITFEQCVMHMTAEDEKLREAATAAFFQSERDDRDEMRSVELLKRLYEKGNERARKWAERKLAKAEPIASLEDTKRLPAGVVYLTTLDPQEVNILATSALQEALQMTVGGRKVSQGFLLHPATGNSSSHIAFRIDKRFSELHGGVGISDGIAIPKAGSPLVFRIVGDGRRLWHSRMLQERGDYERFAVSVRGVEKLELFVDCLAHTAYFCHAVWVDPILHK